MCRGTESSGGCELEDGAGDLGIQLRKRGGGIKGRGEIKKEGEREIKGEDIKHLESNRKEEREEKERGLTRYVPILCFPKKCS